MKTLRSMEWIYVLGTGSCPCPPNGRQRTSRRRPSQMPRHAPYRSTASAMYAEQEGWNRQEPVNSGEISSL